MYDLELFLEHWPGSKTFYFFFFFTPKNATVPPLLFLFYGEQNQGVLHVFAKRRRGLKTSESRVTELQPFSHSFSLLSSPPFLFNLGLTRKQPFHFFPEKLSLSVIISSGKWKQIDICIG